MAKLQQQKVNVNGNKIKIEIGSRVVYAHNDTPKRQQSGYFPSIGTQGTVTEISPYGFVSVMWDNGTRGEGIWMCHKDDIDLVDGQKK